MRHFFIDRAGGQLEQKMALRLPRGGRMNLLYTQGNSR
jgi:hypothetical protein